MSQPFGFNIADYDPQQGGSICFPLGDYKMEITQAELKGVKGNASAGLLELTLTCIEGTYRGLTQMDRLNIFHTSETATRIARQQLAAYAIAIARPFAQDPDQLIGGRCLCTVGPQADDSKYSEVKAVKCMDGSLPQRQGPGQMAPAAPPPGPPPAPPQPAPQQPVPQTAPPVAMPVQQWQTPSQQPVAAPVWAGGQAASSAPTVNSSTDVIPPWVKH